MTFEIILLFICIFYITCVRLVVFCAGSHASESDISDSELSPEELKKLKDLYREVTGEEIDSPREASTSQRVVSQDLSSPGPSTYQMVFQRINEDCETQLLAHLANVTRDQSYCVLNDEIYTYFRNLLMRRSKTAEEATSIQQLSNKHLIEEVLKQTPNIVSRVPGNAMYTLTPENFLIPSLNGVPEALHRAKIISDQSHRMLEVALK